MRISDWSSDVCSSDLLARCEHRLIADHPRSAHFLDLRFTIGNYPMAVEQLHGFAAFVADGDVIREQPVSGIRIGLLGEETRLDDDTDATGHGVRHRCVYLFS